MHVPATLVAELLLAGQPEAEPRTRTTAQPHAVGIAERDLAAERIAVEAGEPLEVESLERQLTDPLGQLHGADVTLTDCPNSPLRRRLLRGEPGRTRLEHDARVGGLEVAVERPAARPLAAR